MKEKRGQYRGSRQESANEAFERQMAKYAEKMRGNAYFEADVWVISVGDIGQGGITLLGFEPDGEDYTFLLAYTSRAKAEAYLNREAVKGEKTTVMKMPLGTLTTLAMTETAQNIGIDKLDHDSDYEMLDVIKMKTMFDAGFTLD